MNKKLSIVANWKMNLSYKDSLKYMQLLCDSLSVGAATFIICPSFISLSSCAQVIIDSPIMLGAQNCSSFESGAYTGQVDAQSLAQIGCRYCIVGHPEQRQLTHETYEDIAKKVSLLIKHQVIPIICVGEETPELSIEQAVAIIEKQLSAVAQRGSLGSYAGPLMIGYEPSWIIGSDMTPSQDRLSILMRRLRDIAVRFFPMANLLLLYGGGVTDRTASSLRVCDDIDGFLLGAVSLDFQKLQNILLLRK